MGLYADIKSGGRVPETDSVEIQRRLGKHAGNYNRWIFDQISPFLGRRILDVGCSIGNITQYYADRELVVGLDVVPESVKIACDRFAGLSFEGHHMSVESPSLTTFRDRGLDSAVCLNVLEHVEDDVQALRNMRDALLPGSTICLLTPMNRWLYGPMDAVDRHYRRYTRTELNVKLGAAHLTLVHQRYFNLLGIAAWWIQNRVIRGEMATPSQYGLFDTLVPVLSRIEAILSPPSGLSMVTVCRTPA